MKTILLTDKHIHPDWKLFQPFFYHHQESGSLSVLPAHSWEDSGWISRKILEEIQAVGEEEWQLIVVESMEAPLDEATRLAPRLAALKKNVLEKLSAKEAGPSAVTVIVLDYLHKNGEPGEHDLKTLRMLALDEYGFVPEKLQEEGAPPSWNDKDLSRLDDVWGEPLELSKAGIRQTPHSRTLEKIDEKRAAVMEEVRRRNSVISVMDPNGPAAALESFAEEFQQRMEEETDVPLQENIEHFRPSLLAEYVLREHISRKAELEGMRVLRREVSRHSRKQRFSSWLETIFFIHLAVESPLLIKHLPEGEIQRLDSELDNELVERMLLTYEASLKNVIKEMETDLLAGRGAFTHRYEKSREAVSVAAAEKADTENKFMETSGLLEARDIRALDRLEAKFEEQLQQWEKGMEDKAEESLKSIKVTSRKPLVPSSETTGLYSYLEELQELEEKQKIEMERYTPPPAEEIEQWRAFTDKKRFQLENRMRARPSAAKTGWTGLLLWAGITGPLLAGISGAPGPETWAEWVLPVLTTAAAAGLAVLGIRRLDRPVKDTLKDIEGEMEKLEREQAERHDKTSGYLSSYFYLERLQKIRGEVQKQLSEHQHHNLLLRFQLRKAKEALNGFEHLRGSLLENRASLERVPSTPEPALEKDEIENRAFSPFRCLDTERKAGAELEITIGRMKRTVPAGSLPVFQRLTFDKDQVDKL